MLDQEATHSPAVDFGFTQDITTEEVKAALCMMGRGKAVGPDEIPIEVRRCLAEPYIRWLTIFFNIILRMARMPQEWRLSVVVPLYKNKGDVVVTIAELSYLVIR